VLRAALTLSALVLLAWLALTAAALQSGDAFIGVALLVLALGALVALTVLWLAFVLVRSLAAARRAARELRG
jgi:hypothetical protein